MWWGGVKRWWDEGVVGDKGVVGVHSGRGSRGGGDPGGTG